ncbi:uncharacterized protein LOC142003821 isoform X3 [Carettochelys insculpta]|uniref:uncharacterized protein LOC142003821 isoform X3 n=1 Tax=Carettochelys insculpta TaxID=44489 RepID=UPI003EBDC4E0
MEHVWGCVLLGALLSQAAALRCYSCDGPRSCEETEECGELQGQCRTTALTTIARSGHFQRIQRGCDAADKPSASLSFLAHGRAVFLAEQRCATDLCNQAAPEGQCGVRRGLPRVPSPATHLLSPHSPQHPARPAPPGVLLLRLLRPLLRRPRLAAHPVLGPPGAVRGHHGRLPAPRSPGVPPALERGHLLRLRGELQPRLRPREHCPGAVPGPHDPLPGGHGEPRGDGTGRGAEGLRHPGLVRLPLHRRLQAPDRRPAPLLPWQLLQQLDPGGRPAPCPAEPCQPRPPGPARPALRRPAGRARPAAWPPLSPGCLGSLPAPAGPGLQGLERVGR